MKRKFTGLIILIFVTTTLYSQRLAYNIYWVQLKDKNGTQYSTDNPGEFLSSRALERRARSSVPVTEIDLPVSKLYLDSLEMLDLEVIGASKWMNSVIIRTNDSLSLQQISRFSFVEDFSTEYANFAGGNPEGRMGKDCEEVKSGKSWYYGAASRQISM